MQESRRQVICIILAMLLGFTGCTMPATKETDHQSDFEAVLSTLRRCGAEPTHRQIEEVCQRLDYDTPEFRRLSFVVFCCVKKQLWSSYTPCDDIDSSADDSDIGAWERHIRVNETQDYTKSQVSLMAFCLHYVRSNFDSLQFKMFKQMGEAVDDVKDGISMSAGLSLNISEKTSELHTTLQSIHHRSTATRDKISAMRVNQRKTRSAIDRASRLIRHRRVHGEVKKYKTIDFFLSSQVYLVLWFIYFVAHFCVKGGFFVRHKADLFRHLVFATLASLALDYGNLTLNIAWLSASTFKVRLLVKAVNLVYFLNGVKSVIGSKAELKRLEILMQVKADCEKLIQFRRDIRSQY